MAGKWGVFLWWTDNGRTSAQINNTLPSKAEARKWLEAKINESAELFEGSIFYDGMVIVPEEHFDECWRLIGATVNGGAGNETV